MSIRNELLEDILSATTGGSFDPTTDISIERLFDGDSALATQNPTGLGTANAIQISFGAAFGTGASPIQLLADGTLRANVAGTYRLKVSVQFGRTGSPGTSFLLFRVVSTGIQLGRTVSTKIDSVDQVSYFENDTWLTVGAGAEFAFEIMRDSSGHNSGGLVGFVPTVDGGNEWNDAPSASVRVERWIQTP